MLVRDPVYGHCESNGLLNGAMYHDRFDDAETVDWRDKRLSRITRFRLLSDPGFPMWDVSYVHGELEDGSLCRVEVPFDQVPKRGFYRFIVDAAKQDGVFAKALGLLSEDTYSKLI